MENVTARSEQAETVAKTKTGWQLFWEQSLVVSVCWEPAPPHSCWFVIYRIKQAEKKLRERQKAYASAEMSPMSGSGGVGTSD